MICPAQQAGFFNEQMVETQKMLDAVDGVTEPAEEFMLCVATCAFRDCLHLQLSKVIFADQYQKAWEEKMRGEGNVV